MMFALLTFVPGTKQRKVYKAAQTWMRDVNLVLRMRGVDGYSMLLPRNADELSLTIVCVMALFDALGALDRGATTDEGWAVLMEHLPT